MHSIEYKECTCKAHDSRSKKLYPKNKVPLERFINLKKWKIYIIPVWNVETIQIIVIKSKSSEEKKKKNIMILTFASACQTDMIYLISQYI